MRLARSASRQPNLIAQFQQRLLLVTGVLLLTIFLRVGVNTYTTLSSAAFRAESLQVQNGISQVLSGMINQETGLRGYLVTTDPVFLQPYNQGRSQYLSALPGLSSVLQQEKWQNAIADFARVRASANTWYTTFALPTLHQAQSGDLAEARSRSLELHGKALFDAFRGTVTRLQQQVNANVAHLETLQSWLNWGFLIAATLLSLGALLLLWSTFVNVRDDLNGQLALLTNVAQHIQAGEHQLRVPALKHEELEVVGHTFNHLIETLLQQQEAIEENVRQLNVINGEFQALFHAVKIAILFVSPSGEILKVNRSFTQFFHLSMLALAGQPLETFREDLASFFEEFGSVQEALKEHTLKDIKMTTLVLQQIFPERRQLELQVQPVFSKNLSYLGCLYLFRDITHTQEQKSLEQNLAS